MRSAKSLLIACMLSPALSAVAQATQPPDPVASDQADDTAIGSGTLENLNLNYRDSNGVGTQDNTGTGAYVLSAEIGGFQNSGFGASSLTEFQYGNENSGFGASTLYFLTKGNYNTALGSLALVVLSSGDYNTAVGYAALNRSTASPNTAVGAEALQFDTTGTSNTGVGTYVLNYTSSGSNNTAVGDAALYTNTSGSSNTALGYQALLDNKTGQQNMAFGSNAGSLITSGSYNIDIGNYGTATDSGIIRIGSSGQQHHVYIQGIYGKPVSGSTVVIDSSGQLGVLASSERYKTDIEPMALDENKLAHLRPVTFHLRSDPHGPLQYGLIAEEVDKVDPNLVIRNEKGRIEGVRYDEITPMLLKQIQAQNAKIASQERLLANQNAKIASLEAQFDQLRAALEETKDPGKALASR